MKYLKRITYVFIFIMSLFFLSNNVYAVTEAHVTGDGLSLRDAATTKNSTIIDTMVVGDTVQILDDNKITNSYCTEGWYHIKYNDKEGYSCSKYITTKTTDAYDRPWNTPAKAIIGGAKWISNGYISKGQFTSYLKKFNVNPNGSYAVYDHLYQSNIQAPAIEAVSSSSSYYKNDSFTLPFTFNIPVYKNMAESYLHPTGKKANLGTTTKTDDAFEKMIKDFPDSYKPYLRQLHQEHNNWTFIPMETNITIEEAAAIFKASGSIDSTNTKLTELDKNGNPIPTGEKGWYYPNLAVTEYYLDPRNFLNESYVFMFEDLSYRDISESVIQGVLNSSNLLKGKDSISNRTYASLFLEAGKTANVNPVYLASLSKVEVGSSQINISGQEFEYNDRKYSGLYNFYNIGASSGATNPVKKGLVYASGGLCQICGTYNGNSNTNNGNTNNNSNNSNTNNNTSYDPKTTLNNIGATLKNEYIKGFNVGTTISSLKAKDSNATYSNTDIVKTGQTITLKDETKYYIVIYGDITGDGNINSADLLKIRQYLLGKTNLTGAYFEAANFNNDNKVNSSTLLKIRQYLLGKTSISQK